MSIVRRTLLSPTPLASGEQLEKLTIRYEEALAGSFTGSVEAYFNPSQLQYSKDVQWEIEPISGVQAGAHWYAFKSSRPQVLTLDLFLDTYEGDPEAATSSAIVRGVKALLPENPITGLINAQRSAADVTTRANAIASLTRLTAALHRPPRCMVWWGRYLLIIGVLTSLGEVYTFFTPSGMPVRGNLSCTFTEAVDPSQTSELVELQSADIAKRHVVRRGETLQSIAFAEYGDASVWRLIADANPELENPRLLTPGMVLTLPPQPVSAG